MLTLDRAVAAALGRRKAAERRQSDADTRMRRILRRAEADGRKQLTVAEDDEIDQLNTEKRSATDAIIAVDGELKALRAAQSDELDLEEQYATTYRTEAGHGAPAYDRVARVGREERTYDRSKDRKGSLFLRDVASVFLQTNPESNMRLARHMQEERVERAEYLQRAAGTGAFAGLTVPQYLTDMYAPAVANMRPFADICNHHDLPPDGMTVNISRITTATSVALQASENAAVSETDIDDTLLTENVQTAAGQQTLSRQAIERGTGAEDVVMGDLFRRYATTLDSTLVNQATTGLAALATTTSYTDGTPTAAELYPKLHGAAAGVEAALLGFAVPSHVIMHSRRWYWLQSQLSNSWPLFAQPGMDPQSGGTNKAVAYGSGSRGTLPNGMAAVVDNNLAINGGAGTNEDIIYVVPADECHLWEDPNAPVFIRAEQAKAASLGVLLVLYGYFAYSFRRYSGAIQSISGTGLITPTY